MSLKLRFSGGLRSSERSSGTEEGGPSEVGMIFFEVAGGPYGAEPVVRKGLHGLRTFVGTGVAELVWEMRDGFEESKGIEKR